MNISYQDEMSRRKKRWIDFYEQGGNKRFIYLIDYIPDANQRPYPFPELKNERIEWAWVKYNRLLAQTRWLKDDKIPFLDVYTGTEIFAEAFGCKVHYPEDSMPFALPLIHNASEVSRLKVPELSSSSLSMVFDIADELKKRGGDCTVLRLPDIQSPMDIAALIWEKSDYYIALIEEPEAVKELAHMVRQLLTSFLDEWFKRYGCEFIAHCPDYYMPKGITLSEDEIGVVNTSIFKDIFLPELVELSERYGAIGIHCCANARHQWDGIKMIPGLKLLNLVQPESRLIEAYSYFEQDMAQMHCWCGNGPAWEWVDKLPPSAHVVLQAQAQTREEALVLSERMWAVCG